MNTSVKDASSYPCSVTLGIIENKLQHFYSDFFIFFYFIFLLQKAKDLS